MFEKACPSSCIVSTPEPKSLTCTAFATPGATLNKKLSAPAPPVRVSLPPAPIRDRKSTRLNSSHTVISYAVFCLKKKTQYNALHHRWELLRRELNMLHNTVRTTLNKVEVEVHTTSERRVPV